MMKRGRADPRVEALVALIDQMIGVIEENTCTCPNDNDVHNSRHAQVTRRRSDSACMGVRNAVAFEHQKQQALKLKPKDG
jgi:hypothetical protein